MKLLGKLIGDDSSGRNLVYSLGDPTILLKKYGLRPGDYVLVRVYD